MSDISFDPTEGHPQRKAILGVLCLSLVLIVASVSSLNVAIPAIVNALEATQTEQLWILDSYALVFAGLLLPAGALGDRYGRKGALLVGMAIFGTFAVFASFMDAAEPLIALRAGMGIGAALIMPATLSIITNVYPPHERAQAIAVWAGFAGAGGAIGPLMSGLLLERFWWGSVFFVNVPIVVVAMVLIVRLVPSSRDLQQRKLDLVGAGLSIVGLGTLVFGIIEGPEKGWTSTTVLGAFAVAVIGIVTFVWWELRQDDPMLDPRFFRNRAFSIGSLTITVGFAVMFGMFFVLTLYLQFVLGHSALGAAVRTLPFAATMIIVSPRTPALGERIGRRAVVAGGLAVQATGFLVASRLTPETPYVVIALAIILMAAGLAAFMPASTEAIVSSLPDDKAGVGSAMNDTTREVGGALGIALLGSILSQGYRNGIEPVLGMVPEQFRGFVSDSIGGAVFAADAAPPEAAAQLLATANDAFIDGLQATFLTGAGVGFVTALIVWFLHPDRQPTGDAEPPAVAATLDA
ncbi:MAG: DHA2 family efflux MFS transporter permease subunit [Acidimicrobiales bacterium]|nr:DHA2 family efflux MFS transporter permease subunit [Acidimicrobiales bacterium]